MNLIEQLGGYDAAKKYLSITCAIEEQDFMMKNHCSLNELEERLLDYRRKNNIFEIGDKVVRLDLESPHIYSIMRIEDSLFTIGRKVRNRTWGTWLECRDIRLATPLEIKAGHRL